MSNNETKYIKESSASTLAFENTKSNMVFS